MKQQQPRRVDPASLPVEYLQSVDVCLAVTDRGHERFLRSCEQAVAVLRRSVAADAV